MITLALQKSGRLKDRSTGLLKDCGIRFTNGDKAKLKIKADNFPLQILFLRDDDIPACVADGAADLGIVGENVIMESEKELHRVKRLGFAACRLSIAVPKETEYRSIDDLQGKRIATSYPRILKNFLKKNQINAPIREIKGSVEIAPGIGLTEAIFDIVSSGSTLIANGLKEVEKVMESQAILVSNGNIRGQKKELFDRLLFRMEAVKKAERFKYILLNAPDDKLEEIAALIPGMKSPTILPLAQKGWHSLHSVISENDFWENIENLKNAGAEGILVIPIENMVI